MRVPPTVPPLGGLQSRHLPPPHGRAPRPDARGMATREVQVQVQVLGLEVMCGPGTSLEALRESMRRIPLHGFVGMNAGLHRHADGGDAA